MSKQVLLVVVLFMSVVFANDAVKEKSGDKFNGWFVGYEISAGDEEDKKIFGAQPLDELTGDRKTEHTLKIGFSSLPSRNATTGKAYVFIWKAPDCNDEIGFGLGGEAEFPFGAEDFKFILGGEAGYGWQPVKGDSVTVSTDANKIGYIIGSSVHYGSYAVKFLDDTAIIRINLKLGVQYGISDFLKIEAGYKLSYLNYQLDYLNGGAPSIANSIDVDNYAHAAYIGVGFFF